jgi:hypothetical protein
MQKIFRDFDEIAPWLKEITQNGNHIVTILTNTTQIQSYFDDYTQWDLIVVIWTKS